MRSLYKETHTFQQRRSLGERFKRRHPNKVPVIVERGQRTRIGSEQIKRYLVPYECTFGHLYTLVRRQLDLSPAVAIILFVKGVIPSSSATMGAIYQTYSDDDLLLYVTYHEENVYGGDNNEPESENPDAQVPGGGAEGDDNEISDSENDQETPPPQPQENDDPNINGVPQGGPGVEAPLLMIHPAADPHPRIPDPYPLFPFGIYPFGRLPRSLSHYHNPLQIAQGYYANRPPYGIMPFLPRNGLIPFLPPRNGIPNGIRFPEQHVRPNLRYPNVDPIDLGASGCAGCHVTTPVQSDEEREDETSEEEELDQAPGERDLEQCNNQSSEEGDDQPSEGEEERSQGSSNGSHSELSSDENEAKATSREPPLDSEAQIDVSRENVSSSANTSISDNTAKLGVGGGKTSTITEAAEQSTVAVIPGEISIIGATSEQSVNVILGENTTAENTTTDVAGDPTDTDIPAASAADQNVSAVIQDENVTSFGETTTTESATEATGEEN